MASSDKKEVPSMASEAVLIRSEKMPENTPTVKGKINCSQLKKGKAVSIYEPPLFQGLPHRYQV